MKIIFKIVLIFFFNINIYAYADEKIAFINLENVLEKTIYGKKILDKLNIENDKNIKNLKIFENELQTLETNIKKKQNIISSEEYANELNKLKIKIKNYTDKKNELVDKFKQLKNNELNIFFNDINPYIEQYMRENSISILLDSKKIYIGKSESDITSLIVELINLNFK
ncbi:OmpH family outer membrane protein [Candidatus Pelagibacter sp. HIMB1509]|uniref:OmpH family outer membrane protein n=1 Tax=Candidatus Pelagibacter sp. HIMB1509 TaxID=3413339 RepID=UPI003F86F686